MEKTKEDKIIELMNFVKSVIETIIKHKDNPYMFNKLYDMADDARFAIYELKKLLKDIPDLYEIVHQAHLTLINCVNFIYIQMNITNSPFKKGKNLIYKLVRKNNNLE